MMVQEHLVKVLLVIMAVAVQVGQGGGKVLVRLLVVQVEMVEQVYHHL
jgi:hypothetical protein